MNTTIKVRVEIKEEGDRFPFVMDAEIFVNEDDKTVIGDTFSQIEAKIKKHLGGA